MSARVPLRLPGLEKIYGGTLLVLSSVSYLHVEYLARHPGLASAELTPIVDRLMKGRIPLFALVPVASMAVAFFSTRAAVYACVLLALMHLFPGQVDDRIGAHASDTA